MPRDRGKRPKLKMLQPRMPPVGLRVAVRVLARRNAEATHVHESRRWREKVRPAKLARDPVCQRCKLLGLVVESAHVDHWTPIAQGGAMWDDDNLVALCASCHSKKTRCEQLGEPFPEVAPSTPRRYVIA